MDIICFCHIRWNFVYQRPQHLMRRFSRRNRVFFIEEPVLESSGNSFIQVSKDKDNIWIATPHLLESYTPDELVFQQRILLSSLYNEYEIKYYMHWFYTPMALIISNHLYPQMVIYDC